jgi:hypothetical protein
MNPRAVVGLRSLAVFVVMTTASVGVLGEQSGALDTGPKPVRAAFYYPWFPEAWNQGGQLPYTNYITTRGSYSTAAATVRSQISDMQYGRISVGIASWFGPGTTTDLRWPALVQAAVGTGFAWAPYYEPEGVSNPSPRKIADDLHYLRTRYGAADTGVLAATGGRMVVFVYNADRTTRRGCAVVRRWTRAQRRLYQRHGERVSIDLKVFPGYTSCAGASAIDGWHQYGPSSPQHDFSSAPGEGSFTISPGFWKATVPYGATPFLARDRARWRAGIANMRSSRADWQLITTYNEWGEGTAIESSSGCRRPVPAGTYCDWDGGNTVSDFMTDLHNAPLT